MWIQHSTASTYTRDVTPCDEEVIYPFRGCTSSQICGTASLFLHIWHHVTTLELAKPSNVNIELCKLWPTHKRHEEEPEGLEHHQWLAELSCHSRSVHLLHIFLVQDETPLLWKPTWLHYFLTKHNTYSRADDLLPQNLYLQSACRAVELTRIVKEAESSHRIIKQAWLIKIGLIQVEC
jgi:hypothetical protein